MKPEELKGWRESYGLSRAELARLLEVTTVTIWRYENGERKIPPFLALALETLERRLKK